PPSAPRPGPPVTVSGAGPMVTLATAEQAGAYLERCAKLDRYLRQAADRLRAGIDHGRTPSERGVRAAIAQLDEYLATPPARDPLLAPDPPADVDRARWRGRLLELVAGAVRPA